ncbi:MAG: DapH/DapD/GlmU-related protein [Candidatus Sericytochromatia bacterium]
MTQSTSDLSLQAFGLGLRRRRGEHTLDVWFPQIAWQEQLELGRFCADFCGFDGQSNGFVALAPERLQDLRQALEDVADSPLHGLLTTLLGNDPPPAGYARLDVICFFLSDAQAAVATAEEAYFKLQTLSQRHVQPHGVNLDGAFKALHNLAWTNQGPILPADLEHERLKALLAGQTLVVSHVDKFPYLVNYHVPSGVRIAAGSQVRLGAYLGEGTTVMPAGYVNFNAGTAGQAMIEGRVSAGVFVGDKSDVGGGASIMGTLSGGNQHVISVGSQCLLGANAGTGISLGDGCTIAAGLYITAGTKVTLLNLQDQPVNLAGEPVSEGDNLCKAAELSGRSHLLFYQDSLSGRVICKPNRKTIALNSELHTHN